MSLRLSRVFIRGLGPASARYDPLLADFRNENGEADHSVLWLRNGGGKTTFERLVFHVVAWTEARNIGKEDKTRPGGIEYLLGPDDVGHIVLEWVRADAPDALALITGLVCQLKPGTGSRRDDDGNLKRARADVDRRFYCFHARDGIDLDAIAGAQLSDGRRLALVGYAKVLDSLNATNPRLALETTGSVGEWTRMLQDRGLDSELFRYQVRMNQGEGGADQVIAGAATNEQFIDFVLRSVTPSVDVDDVRQQFERHRDELAERPTLRARRLFVAALKDTMSLLASTYTAERAANEAVLGANAESRVLHGSLLSAAAREKQAAEEAASRQSDLRRRRTDADTARKRHNAEAAWLEHWAITERLKVVNGELDEVNASRRAAKVDAAAWPLTEAILGLTTANELAAQLAAALRERDDQTAPLRTEHDRYAAAVRAAYTAMAAHHNEVARLARQEADLARAAAEDHAEAARLTAGTAATAEEKIRQLDARLETAARTHAQAVSAGLLEPGQSARTVRDALAGEADVERKRASQLDEDAFEAARAANSASSARVKHQGEQQAAESRSDATQRSLDDHRREHEEVAALPTIGEVVDDGSPDLHSGARVVIVALRTRVESIETEARETSAQLEDARRNLQALADRQLLAPRSEVARAVELLRGSHIEAMSGFEYLDDAAPTLGRGRLVARHPHLADGVVLTATEADVNKAVELLVQAGLAPTFPVTIAPAANLLSETDVQVWEVWGGDEALFDKTAAAARRLTLVHDAQRLEARVDELVNTSEQSREALTALNGLTARWPESRLSELNSELSAAATAVQAAQALVQSSKDAFELAQAAERAARAAAKESREDADRSLKSAELLSQAAQAENAADGAEILISAQREVLASARSEETAHRLAEKASHDTWEAAVKAHGEHSTSAAQARTAAAEVARVTFEPEPELLAQPLGVLVKGLNLARLRLNEEIGDDALSRALEEAQREASRHDGTVRLAQDRHVARATELCENPSSQTPDGRSRETRTAVEAVERYDHRRSDLDSERGGLEVRLTGVSRERTQPAQLPVDLLEAERLREAALEETARQRAVGESMQERIDSEATVERNATHDAEVLNSLVDPSLDAHADEVPFSGSPQSAKEERDIAAAKCDSLKAEHQRCLRALESARRKVGDQLRDPAAESAQDLVQKLSRADDELFAAHAQELTDELTGQAALIDERLTGLDTDRDIIVQFLEPRVGDAIGRLRALERTSRLPASLGVLGDSSFLSIRFDPPGDKSRRLALVGTALDELLQSQATPDGFKLLLLATLKVIGRVRVSLLKPEPGMPNAQKIPVSAMSDLSGGERATIAILLYCALSNLRRATLSRSGQLATVGTLLLDNPFGKASSGFLVDQQKEMATALGIQLIYATAIEDANALDRFPVLVRLRNRQDVTRSMRYVRHDGRPAAADDSNPVSIEAARLVHRESG